MLSTRRLLWIASLTALWSVSGCAIYSPFEVKRYWVDYNSERQFNAQYEVFDHLPPKTARVKMVRWGYNIGPHQPMPVSTWGKIKDSLGWPWFSSPSPPNEQGVWVETAPGMPLPVISDESNPVLPAPPVNDNLPLPPDVPVKTSANSPSGLKVAAYQQRSREAAVPPRSKSDNAAWLFSSARRGQP